MKVLKSIEFDIKDQKDFARFSGDYNPMHIDEVSARRFLFGKPVVHGINIVLNALDAWASIHKRKFHLSIVQGKFLKPVFLNEEVIIKFHKNENTYTLQIVSQNSVCSSLLFELKSKHSEDNDFIIDEFPEEKMPMKHTLESIKGLNGDTSLYLKKKFLKKLFPNLYIYSGFSQIASLLSSSRIVGMYCPGMNSVYSSFSFSFNEKFSKIIFKLDKSNRFGFVSIVIDGQCNGNINAFLRPTHVKQLNSIEVKKFVKKHEFKNQSALIVGGSRGIGEVTAKILAAGGADVLITYNKGKEDAKNICDDIKSSGGKVSMIFYDINNPTMINDFEPSDIYYFATPHIFSGQRDVFSTDLFAEFSKYYLGSFHDLVKLWADKKVCNYFYPSTIYVEELPEDMMEYALTKLSAEKMCEHLEKNTDLKIFKPRLPRLETDQTVSFLPIKNNNTLEYMLKIIKEYNCYKYFEK